MTLIAEREAAARAASDAERLRHEALAASSAERDGESSAFGSQLRLAQGKLAAAERTVQTVSTSKRILVEEVRELRAVLADRGGQRYGDMAVTRDEVKAPRVNPS